VRTTLTLDPDVAAKLKAEVRRSGRPFKQVVNDHLRQALTARRVAGPRAPFQVRTRPLDPIAGLSVDNVEALLDQIEGATRR
jgi:hypothetical protein